MTRPQKYLTRITLFLIPVTLLCLFLYPRLHGAFMTNIGLNGLIFAVLLIGIVFSIRQVSTLNPAVRWIEDFRKAAAGEINVADLRDAPKIVAPMAAMIGDTEKKLSLSAISMRTLLDGIAARMDESREITRYFIGLLIFLGLLGTFWGLLGTIGAIKDTIGNLAVGSNDITNLFEDLKDGLAAPLGGMGTAFSSSLFGLAGSVVLGFVDLQAGQAQSRFFNDLEDWLSGLTKLSRGSSLSGSALDEGDSPDANVPAYVGALLEQSADSLENLHNVVARSEEKRSEVNKALLNLSEQLSTLADSQTEMRAVLKQMLELFSRQLNSEDDTTKVTHLRNIDVQFKFLTDETVKGQQQINDTLKSEFRLLARTLGTIIDRNATQKKPAAEKTPPAPSAASDPAPDPALLPEMMDYEMPTPKPKSDKKPIITSGKKLTARKDE